MGYASLGVGELETELKFRVPDSFTFEQLVEVETLGGYQVGIATSVEMHDRYLDTADGALLGAGFSCRLRETSRGARLLTIKSLEVSGSGLHVRQEIETVLPAGAAVSDLPQWPMSEARDLVSALVGAKPLAELFDLRQQRFQRLILGADGSVLVEMSVDRVWPGGPDDVVILGVEAEVQAEQGAELLTALADAFLQTWHLVPEPRAKFWQALEIVRPDLLPAEFTSTSGKGPDA